MLSKAQIQAGSYIVLDDNGTLPPDACFDDTSYNLRLGDEYMVIGQDSEVRYCSAGVRQLRIPPFGCALVSTREIVKLPDDVFGRWGLKIKPALAGLVFQAGPQIEPGSYTRLFGLLFNLSDTNRTIPYEQAMWSIDFEQVAATHTTIPAAPLEKLEQYTNSLWGVPTGSIREIYDSYRKLQEQSTAKREFGINLLIVIVVFLASVTVPTIQALSNRNDPSPGELEKRISQLEQTQSNPGSPAASPSSGP